MTTRLSKITSRMANSTLWAMVAVGTGKVLLLSRTFLHILNIGSDTSSSEILLTNAGITRPILAKKPTAGNAISDPMEKLSFILRKISMGNFGMGIKMEFPIASVRGSRAS